MRAASPTLVVTSICGSGRTSAHGTSLTVPPLVGSSADGHRFKSSTQTASAWPLSWYSDVCTMMANGSTGVSIYGEVGGSLYESIRIDSDHGAFAKRSKEPGWHE